VQGDVAWKLFGELAYRGEQLQEELAEDGVLAPPALAKSTGKD
jgi:hypothetical protein